MQTQVLRSLLMDVRLNGSVRIEKKKLLWMLDCSNDSKTAWVRLTNEWKEVSPDGSRLYGMEYAGEITLTARITVDVQNNWAA